MLVANHIQLRWPALKILLCLSLYLKALRNWVRKVKQNLPENCLKCTEIANAVSKFLNTFRGSMSQDPLKSFCSSICFQLILPEKSTFEKMSNFGATSLKEISECSPDMKHFQRAYLRLFPGLNV